MKPQEFMTELQLQRLQHIHSLIQGLYEVHDNPIVYALTGLISELTNIVYVDKRYVQEKVDIIFGRHDNED
jgi:hypothetical protein